MATYLVEEEKLIPEGEIVRARLEALTEKTIQWTDRDTRQQKQAKILEWNWKVTKGQFAGELVKGSCDAKLTNSEGNRFRQWAEALLQRELTVDNALDTDDLVGLSADIQIGHKPSKKTGRVFPEVVEVIPISGSSDDVPF